MIERVEAIVRSTALSALRCAAIQHSGSGRCGFDSLQALSRSGTCRTGASWVLLGVGAWGGRARRYGCDCLIPCHQLVLSSSLQYAPPQQPSGLGNARRFSDNERRCRAAAVSREGRAGGHRARRGLSRSEQDEGCAGGIAVSRFAGAPHHDKGTCPRASIDGRRADHHYRGAGGQALRIVNDLLDTARLDGGICRSISRSTRRTTCWAPWCSMSRDTDRTRLVASLDDPSTLSFGSFDFVHSLESLANLVDNALKYSPVDATVKVSRCRRGLVFHVSDRGLGIPLEDQEGYSHHSTAHGRAIRRKAPSGWGCRYRGDWRLHGEDRSSVSAELEEA